MAKKVVNKRKKASAPTTESTLDVKELEQAHADETLDEIADIEKEHMGDPELLTGIYHPEVIEITKENGDKAKMLIGVDLANDVDKSVMLNEGEHIVDLKYSKDDYNKVKSTPKTVEPLKPTVNEAVVNIAGSTPTKDFAVSVCKFFDEHPNAVLRVRAIGAGASHQLTKSTIEANKLLVPRGQVLARFDFWTNENDKSVNNTRLVVTNIVPNSLSQALTGQGVQFMSLEAFMHKEGETK